MPIAFTTHHPQGMVKIGSALFVSSVEVQVRTKPFPQPVDGLRSRRRSGRRSPVQDRLAGQPHRRSQAGRRNHLSSGRHRLRRHVHLGRRSPSTGPTAARSSTASIPKTMKATEVFRFADHIGAIVHNTDDHTLHGVSWGSRRFYRWTLDRDGRSRTPTRRPKAAHAQHVALSSTIRTASTPAAAACCAPASPKCARRQTRRRFGWAASISSISPTAGRCTRCRCCSGPPAVST